jgi:hypothetical protein
LEPLVGNAFLGVDFAGLILLWLQPKGLCAVELHPEVLNPESNPPVGQQLKQALPLLLKFLALDMFGLSSFSLAAAQWNACSKAAFQNSYDW